MRYCFHLLSYVSHWTELGTCFTFCWSPSVIIWSLNFELRSTNTCPHLVFILDNNTPLSCIAGLSNYLYTNRSISTHSANYTFPYIKQVVNGLLGRDDLKEALQLPIGIVPAGSDNSLVWSVLGIRDPVSAATALAKVISWCYVASDNFLHEFCWQSDSTYW